jgi:hypothetical protein
VKSVPPELYYYHMRISIMCTRSYDCTIILLQSVTASGAFMIVTGRALGGTGTGAVSVERPGTLENSPQEFQEGRLLRMGLIIVSYCLYKDDMLD